MQLACFTNLKPVAGKVKRRSLHGLQAQHVAVKPNTLFKIFNHKGNVVIVFDLNAHGNTFILIIYQESMQLPLFQLLQFSSS
jgi:hypothetical protein